MKMQIKEFAEITGVSVRTLHYYDEIGLLRPADVDRVTGYRFYDDQSLLRMQEILFYRELGFSLKSIGEILSSPNYDKDKALKEQKQLLVLQKERLERLIDAIDNAAKGENVMKAFDNSEFEKYKSEAQKRWGNTDAYKEHAQKTKNYGKDKWNSLIADMDDIFREFAVCMKNGNDSNAEESQSLNANENELPGIGGAIKLICREINDFYNDQIPTQEWKENIMRLIADSFDDYITILRHLWAVVQRDSRYKAIVFKEDLAKGWSGDIVSKIYEQL
jgi:DNA-binding transcriptional MerR regulator